MTGPDPDRPDPAVPLVLVSVGTDHHRFDRLMGWIEDWLADRVGAEPVRCYVQHGTSRLPRGARGTAYLDHDALQALLREASAVVVHGGPTTISESRRCGRRPIVVARSPEHGEHVDDHQLRFCARMAAKDVITLVDGETGLRAELDRAVRSPDDFAVPADAPAVAAAVRRFAELVETMYASRPRR